MNNYDLFAKYFDDLMINPIKKAKKIEAYIKKHHPKAKNVLDIGCGTGSVLKNLSDKFDKTGIDLSANMLAKAKPKFKAGKFYRMDMRSFHLDRKFDVILCIYDSINHLLTFNDWQNFFHRVKIHLNKNGLFIFDMNTPFRLKSLSASQPQIQKFGKHGKHLCSISVSQTKANIFNWNVKIFEHQTADKYRLIEENILESCFPISQVRRSLLKEFNTIFTVSNEKEKPSRFSSRIWFLCKN